MHKKLFAILMAVTLLMGASLPAMAAKTEEYVAATASAVQTYSVKRVDEKNFNLIANGDFEVVGTDGKPKNISPITTDGKYMTAVGKEGDTGNFARLMETNNVYLSTTVKSIVPGETYTFSVDVRIAAGTPTAWVQLNINAGDNSQKLIKYFKEAKQGKGWVTETETVEVPEGCTSIQILIRANDGGEVHYDNVALIGLPPEDIRIVEDFKAEVQKDIDHREKLAPTKDATKGLYTLDPVYPGQPENILKNSDFENFTGPHDLEGWGVQERHKPYISAVSGDAKSGNGAIRMYAGAEENSGLPFFSQHVYITGGAEYQVSYWYKLKAGDAAKSKLGVKVEFSADSSLPGAAPQGEKYCTTTPIADGEWHQHTVKIYPGPNAAEMTVLVRFMDGVSSEPKEVLVDDLRIYMTTPPKALNFDTGRIFFYPDLPDTAFSVNVNTGFFPNLANARIDFDVFEGDTCIWESKNNHLVNGQISVPYPASIIAKKDTTYVARATLYDENGAVFEYKGQNLFLYDRPEYIGEDGIFRKNGNEIIYPTYAYHVNAKDFEKSMEGNINMVQIGSWSTTAEAVKALDDLEARGMYAHVVLYPNMKPAGSEVNMENTVRNVLACKDHPAVVDYIVMDEIFLNLQKPEQDMENSYRLIRSLDTKHPVAVMEAMPTKYKEAAKYVDVLLIDPYSSATAKAASVKTEQARVATNYEKPVYSLLEAYYSQPAGIPNFPTANDIRNNNYQALIKGAAIIGYYSISDCDMDMETLKQNLAPWEARDGGKMWDAMVEFGTKELKLAYDHYSYDKTPRFNEYLGEKYWYSSWVDGSDLYLVVLSLLPERKIENPESQTISVPLTSFGGNIKIGAYTATGIGGRTDTVTGNGTFDITLKGSEAVLYKITPAEAVDFSTLGATRFEDLGTHNWARQQISRLDSLGIVEGRNLFMYAPADNITRAELAGFLVRTLGLTSDSTETFADVTADTPYAKEIAIGKALGVLKGTDGVNYNPNASISRQDLMVICARGMRLVKELAAGAPASSFPDAGLIASYASEDIGAMVAAGIVKGNADGTINPVGNTTRAEAAVIMDRVLNWK